VFLGESISKKVGSIIIAHPQS